MEPKRAHLKSVIRSQYPLNAVLSVAFIENGIINECLRSVFPVFGDLIAWNSAAF